MKFLKVISFIIVLATVVSCKKDHPNDIPNWVKNAIKEFKRDGNSHDIKACLDVATTIKEYSVNSTGELFYCFEHGGNPISGKMFDKDGNELCYIVEVGLISHPVTTICGSNMLKDFTYKRTIWTASCQ